MPPIQIPVKSSVRAPRRPAGLCAAAHAPQPPSVAGQLDAVARSHADHASFLESLPLFAALPPKVIEGIARQARTVRLARHAVLFQRGTRATGFWLVISGRVQLVLPAEGGADKVLASFGPGTPFGEAAMFGDLPYPVDCRAVEDTEVLFVPAGAVLPALHRSGELAQRFLRDISLRMHGLIGDIAQYTQKSAESRIASLLLQLAPDGVGAPALDGMDAPAPDGSLSVVAVRLPDRKRAIASRLSVAPETLSRTLRAFQDDGLIEVDGYQVLILDAPRLAAIAQTGASGGTAAPCALAGRLAMAAMTSRA